MDFSIVKYLNRGSSRTILIKKNILTSFFLKFVNILVSLLIVPLTLNYVNPVKYGIWLTLSSIVAWMSFFDFGFANGFRNRYAETKVKGDIALMKSYVSTTYAILILIFSIVYLLFYIGNSYINWSALLNVSPDYLVELRNVFSVLVLFVCANIVLDILSTLFIADQRPALSALLKTVTQICALVTIFCISAFHVQGSLLLLAISLTGIPCIITIIISLFVYSKSRYRIVSPSFKMIDFSLTSNILGLGWNFFLIMLTNIVIFQTLNVIISNLFGPEIVTQYNILYKYFNVMGMLFTIIISPYWSAFTDAYVNNDRRWMLSASKKLEKLWCLCIPCVFVMALLSKFVIRLWLGNNMNVPVGITIATAIFTLSQTFGWLYMYLINGIGKVRIQMLVYTFFSVISIPSMILLGKYTGVESMLLFLVVIYVIQGLLGRIQLKKLINGVACGIWNK